MTQVSIDSLPQIKPPPLAHPPLISSTLIHSCHPCARLLQVEAELVAIDGGSPSAVEVHVSEAEAAAEERADRTACDLQARSRLAWQPNVFSRR